MENHFEARVAEAYGRHSEKYASILEPILAPMAAEIAALASLKPGEKVLDLATGTGLIARTAAGFTDFVVGVDLAFGVLVRARELAAGEIPYLTADAHKLPFENRCFDRVICGLSLSHFSHVQRALAEVRRVLRAGGRFLTTAWGTGGQSPSKSAAIRVRNKFLEDRAITFEGPFSNELWADLEQGRQALQGAGFADIQVKTMRLTGQHKSHSDAIEAALAWPLTRYRIARLDPAQQRQLREETAAAILEIDDLRWESQIHYYQAARPAA